MPELSPWIIELAFVVYAIMIGGVIVLERRRPTATWALLLVLVFVPVIGLVAYLIFGRGRMHLHRSSRRHRVINAHTGTQQLSPVEEVPGHLHPAQQSLIRLALRSGGTPVRRSNGLQLLETQTQTWDALKHAIDSATRTIHCEFYIWRDDESGRRITKWLTNKAREGVSVRVLLDFWGNVNQPFSHFSELVHAGGKVAFFGRPRWYRLSRFDFRNHRKIITIDGTLGIVGGLNIGDEYLAHSAIWGRWRDLFMMIDGDAVIGLDATIVDDWLAATGEIIDLDGAVSADAQGLDGRKRPRKHPWQTKRPAAHELESANPFYPPPQRPVTSSGPLVQLIPTGPDLAHTSALAVHFSAAVGLSMRRVWITTPYLIPDDAMLMALCSAAMRGVDVRILVPAVAASNHKFIAYAAASYFDELLAAGCKIYEYQDQMLHSKYMVIDDGATIGSANIDIRSFHFNYEITVILYDAEFAEQVAELFERDITHARPVPTNRNDQLRLRDRLAEGVCRLVSPLL